MPSLDLGGDSALTCGSFAIDVSRTADDLLQKVRYAVAGESFDTLMATAKTVTFTAVVAYWDALLTLRGRPGDLPLQVLTPDTPIEGLPGWAEEMATAVGTGCSELDAAEAGYRIGSLYTSLMPEEIRSQLGAYYTPPALCERLLDMVSAAGVEWATTRVLDPACGGGAFLSPLARRMMDNLPTQDPGNRLSSVESRLQGLEVDPFAAWLSQVLFDATLLDTCLDAGRLPNPIVTVCDALEADPEGLDFGLVVGNPPYGRVRLNQDMRRKFARSLFGHANLYGIFTDLALRFANPHGVVGYVTPTSFLAGAYFKALRALLGQKTSLDGIDFMTERRGVFEDVLQETALTVYRLGNSHRPGRVRFTSVLTDGSVESVPAGSFRIPQPPDQPWVIPRRPENASLVRLAQDMPCRLSDYGYGVSTGPLVWNRHKEQFRSRRVVGCLPVVWAESIRGGEFQFRAENRNHQKYFRPKRDQDWLIADTPCVLLQRTTAKEQGRRLVAAELPAEFVSSYGGAVIENHVNVIRPLDGGEQVSTAVLLSLLNSEFVDQLFRCINGSVAVSAYELEALPLPDPWQLTRLDHLVVSGADTTVVEREVKRLYRECS
jgi:adenine-specific DNA-methyltransferase